MGSSISHASSLLDCDGIVVGIERHLTACDMYTTHELAIDLFITVHVIYMEQTHLQCFFQHYPVTSAKTEAKPPHRRMEDAITKENNTFDENLKSFISKAGESILLHVSHSRGTLFHGMYFINVRAS